MSLNGREIAEDIVLLLDKFENEAGVPKTLIGPLSAIEEKVGQLSLLREVNADV